MKITPVHYKTLCKIFEKTGWKHVRTKGDHFIYKKDEFIRPIVIPAYKSVPVFIIKNNLRTAQISREEYFDLLKQAA